MKQFARIVAFAVSGFALLGGVCTTSAVAYNLPFSEWFTFGYWLMIVMTFILFGIIVPVCVYYFLLGLGKVLDSLMR